jgi:hypothetical protein
LKQRSDHLKSLNASPERNAWLDQEVKTSLDAFIMATQVVQFRKLWLVS